MGLYEDNNFDGTPFRNYLDNLNYFFIINKMFINNKIK